MARSHRLRLHQVRSIFELAHRVCNVGHDPDQWRRIALEGLCALVKANVALSADVICRAPSNIPQMVAPIDIGWQTESTRRRFYSYFTSGEVKEDPGTAALLASHANTRFTTWTRRSRIEDPAWYSSPTVSETRRSGDVDDFIASTASPTPGVLQGFVLYRPWNDRPFSPSECRTVRLFHLQLLRMIVAGYRAARQNPQIDSLPPRVRQTLMLLLRGLSLKEAAAAMGLSYHTVNGYQKHLHKAFDVSSRAELLARFVNRSSEPAVTLPPELAFES